MITYTIYWLNISTSAKCECKLIAYITQMYSSKALFFFPVARQPYMGLDLLVWSTFETHHTL
jgi:hypothetical protein